MKLCACLILLMLANVMFYNLSPCASASVPNARLVNFVQLLSSNFTDKQEVSEDLQNNEIQVHSMVSVSTIPVKVPGFPSPLTFILKELFTNKMLRLGILSVSMDSDGVLRIQRYPIPNTEKYAFETPESEIIAGITEDLKALRTECDVTYTEIEPNVFFGTLPDCLDSPDTTDLEVYPTVLTCNALSGFVPSKAQEASNPRAYRLSVSGRYSLSLFADILVDISSVKDPCTCA